MPRLASESLHRLHIMVSAADHEWIKTHIPEGELSMTFRQIIKRLRGEKILRPNMSVVELLDRGELTL